MLSLVDSTESLVVIADADPAVNQPVVLVKSGGVDVLALMTGDAAKTLLTGPANDADPAKDVSLVHVYNKDTATVNVTISKKVGDTTYNLVKEDIPSGGTLSWVPGTAPVVTDGAASSAATVGASAQATVAASEQGFGPFRQTILTLANTPITVGNTTGVSFGGVKLYDFPEARINVLGVQLNDLTVGLGHAGNLTPIDAADGGDIALGTTAPTDGTLTGTDVDLMPSTSIDPISGGIASGQLAAAATLFDGRTTPIDMFLGMLIDDDDVANGASDVLLLSGTITITWVNLGND